MQGQRTKKEKMEDKKIETSNFYISLARIECLLEEIIFRQIAAKYPDEQEASQKFKTALQNVADDLKEKIQSLPNLK